MSHPTNNIERFVVTIGQPGTKPAYVCVDAESSDDAKRIVRLLYGEPWIIDVVRLCPQQSLKYRQFFHN